jgi:hypothetical protein
MFRMTLVNACRRALRRCVHRSGELLNGGLFVGSRAHKHDMPFFRFHSVNVNNSGWQGLSCPAIVPGSTQIQPVPSKPRNWVCCMVPVPVSADRRNPATWSKGAGHTIGHSQDTFCKDTESATGTVNDATTPAKSSSPCPAATKRQRRQGNHASVDQVHGVRAPRSTRPGT